MKNAEYVYAVVEYHDDDNNLRLKLSFDVSSIHRTLRDAEIQCAKNNMWRKNAKPNPEFKRTHMPQHQNYIKIYKHMPASWCYVKMVKID